jgi:hypothetical protein
MTSNTGRSSQLALAVAGLGFAGSAKSITQMS